MADEQALMRALESGSLVSAAPDERRAMSLKLVALFISSDMSRRRCK